MTKPGTVAEPSGPRSQEGAVQGQLTELLSCWEGDSGGALLACRKAPAQGPWMMRAEAPGHHSGKEDKGHSHIVTKPFWQHLMNL